MISDYFSMAFKNLRRRKLRAWLTIIGIVISIATIFVLISISVGLQDAIKEEFRLLGTDKFFIQPGGQLGPPGTATAAVMTTRDINVIKQVSGVKQVTEFIIGNAKIEYNRESRYKMVFGLNLATVSLYFESTGLSIIEGRALKKGDSYDVALGYNYKYGNVFNKPINVGDIILINGASFKVRGIVSRIGNSQDDENIYLPEDIVRKMFNITNDRVDYITVQTTSNDNVKEVASRVEKKLRQFRGVTEKTQDFTILTPEELLTTVQTILSVITAFLLGVAAISLIVGGIGIANTMYTSVLERTNEIGVMKSVGARNKDIALLFLIESGLIGLVGGLIGVLLGIVAGKTISLIAANALGTTLLQAATPAYLIIGCLAFAFIIGAIFGVWPAFQASKIRPVDALRYE